MTLFARWMIQTPRLTHALYLPLRTDCLLHLAQAPPPICRFVMSDWLTMTRRRWCSTAYAPDSRTPRPEFNALFTPFWRAYWTALPLMDSSWRTIPRRNLLLLSRRSGSAVVGLAGFPGCTARPSRPMIFGVDPARRAARRCPSRRGPRMIAHYIQHSWAGTATAFRSTYCSAWLQRTCGLGIFCAVVSARWQSALWSISSPAFGNMCMALELIRTLGNRWPRC